MSQFLTEPAYLMLHCQQVFLHVQWSTCFCEWPHYSCQLTCVIDLLSSMPFKNWIVNALLSLCVSVCTHAWMRVCVCVCVRAHMHACIYVYAWVRSYWCFDSSTSLTSGTNDTNWTILISFGVGHNLVCFYSHTVHVAVLYKSWCIEGCCDC